MKISFGKNSLQDSRISEIVLEFLDKIPTLEKELDMPVVIFQDGVENTYYIKCTLRSDMAASFVDLSALLDSNSQDEFKYNRDLRLTHSTYKKMREDALKGREFNDIIVEYNTEYRDNMPLKVWGGQHRLYAIKETYQKILRYHGFRVYFNLSKDQRSKIALISNTSIIVTNDTFDRMIEETIFGDKLRRWCQKVGFFSQSEDFPDYGSRSERITVKLARCFVVNFFLGKEKGALITEEDIDNNVYEPYLASTGVIIDKKYADTMTTYNILEDSELFDAGKHFLELHKAQYSAVKSNPKIKDRKAFRCKALIESVLCGWSYVAGLLHISQERLGIHYSIPRTTSAIPDPLNASEMSSFKHDQDPPQYRGLGTRSSLKDRQRVAQLFIARSKDANSVINKELMRKAVSRVIGLISIKDGY